MDHQLTLTANIAQEVLLVASRAMYREGLPLLRNSCAQPDNPNDTQSEAHTAIDQDTYPVELAQSKSCAEPNHKEGEAN